MEDILLKTPLHAWHVEHGAAMTPFAGWDMPVRYAQIREEHHHVRESVGIFDVSHMGELRIQGPTALEMANSLFTNDLEKALKPEGEANRALYGAILNEAAGILDDVIAYPSSREDVLFCVNASNLPKIRAWMEKHVGAPNRLIDESGATAQLAVQGPKAPQLLTIIFGDAVSGLKPMRFVEASFRGVSVTVATTGYTGESGGEIFVPNEAALDLCKALMEAGADLGCRPIGLGARDTLRLEKGFCLYGNDIDETTTPWDAGLGWVVRMAKGDFIGREALAIQKEAGVTRRLCALKMDERGVPRHGYAVRTECGEGVVTSGTMSPILGVGIAMAYVPIDVAEGAVVEVEIHRSWRKGRVVALPFV